MPFHRLLAVGALALGLMACTPALNWREVSPGRSSARALLPCKPDQAIRSVPLGGVLTELNVIGCDVAGTTFAVMTATLEAGRAPDEVLAGWQQATLANMQADAASVLRTDFHPPGGLPLPHAQRVRASGRRGDGRVVVADAVWTARASAGGTTELLHAVTYADRPQPDATDAFFAGVRWP